MLGSLLVFLSKVPIELSWANYPLSLFRLAFIFKNKRCPFLTFFQACSKNITQCCKSNTLHTAMP